MNFSEEWEDTYRNSSHLSIWPWSDMVSYVMRYIRPGKHSRVLEIGCGAGANIPFFKHLNVDYYAIEGSLSIVKRLYDRFPDLRDKIIVGDFTIEIATPGLFDLVVDRASLTHNTTAAIKKGLSNVHDKLKPGCKYIGIDWFSTLHSDYDKGTTDDDVYTKKDYCTGQFADIGRVHFSDKKHIIELFEKFSIDLLEHKIIKREIPESDHTFASWNLIARKI